MTTISNFLVPDHKRCDALFADAEAVASKGDWANAATGFVHFKKELQHHFAMEEEVMFPAFEVRSGMLHGPTSVMRSEHRQMEALLNQLTGALARKDATAFLGDADTMLILMQQHNVKEEQMLYPMADKTLAGECGEVVGRMRALA